MGSIVTRNDQWVDVDRKVLLMGQFNDISPELYLLDGVDPSCTHFARVDYNRKMVQFNVPEVLKEMEKLEKAGKKRFLFTYIYSARKHMQTFERRTEVTGVFFNPFNIPQVKAAFEAAAKVVK